MSSYLDRLKVLDDETHLGDQPTKPTKAPFGSFVGDPGRCVSPKLGKEALPGEDQTEFEERAAICEYDGELPRSHAELMAAACTVPLAPGESIERRDSIIIHFADHLDRLRRPARKAAGP